jgi:transcriptional regulator with XRE-family HTH domain
MASDHGPVVQSARLRNELIQLRKDRALTQQQVAEAMEWSTSKIIRVEGGASSITRVDLDALLTMYHVTSGSQRERLHALNRGAKEVAWWSRYKDDLSPDYLNYVGYEAGAAFIRQFLMGGIPGLLQTAEYAEVITRVGPIDRQKVESAARFRLRRQEELRQRSNPPHQYFVLDEAAIRRHIGIKTDRAIMPNQLRHVANRAERDPLVTVRVIPFDAGAHPGLIAPFTLLEFEAGLPDILFLDADQPDSTMIVGGDPRVAEHAVNFQTLLELALPDQESIKVIRSAAEEMS